MITAREKGRQLELIVGGGEDQMVFLVPPINTQTGSELLSEWVGLATGQADVTDVDKNAEDDPGEAERLQTTRATLRSAEYVARTSLSNAVYDDPRFQGELRWAEQEQIVNSAFMWNVQGGGIDLVELYLVGGLPKAREELLKRTGLHEAFSIFSQLLDSASDALMSEAGSLGTSTPTGTGAQPSSRS